MAPQGDDKGGTSFPTRPDTQAKTARPTSVGPHHPTRDQEDPGNPGITPDKGYGTGIAANKDPRFRGPGAGPVAPTPKHAERTGVTEEEKQEATKDPPVQPLSGTTRGQDG